MPSVTLTVGGDSVAFPYSLNTPIVPATPNVSHPDVPTITWAQLAKPNDTLSMALARMTTPAHLDLEAGEYSDTGFDRTNNQVHYPSKILLGMSGPDGTAGGINGVTLTVDPNTMSAADKAKIPAQSSGGTNPFSVFTAIGGQFSSLRNIALEGTDQGANYHGLSIFNPTNAAGKPITGGLVYNLKMRGTRGDNGANPGETFQLTLHGCDGWNIVNIECDGTYASDQQHSWGAVGFTVQNSQGVQVWNPYVHDVTQSYAVAYQSDNLAIYNPIFGRAGGDLPIGLAGVKPLRVFNGERASNITLVNPQFNKVATSGVHVTHSNPNPYTATFRNGNSAVQTDGKLTILNPTWNNIWGDNLLYIQRDYDANVVTPPLVTKADGVTHQPYKWVTSQGHATVS